MANQTEIVSRLNNYRAELVGAHTDKGPSRDGNEDAYWIPDKNSSVNLGALYIAADGVGGQEEGAAAAQLAVLVVSESFYRFREDGRPLPESLKEAVLRANQAVYAHAESRNIGRMGCTIIAAVRYGEKLHIAHVGDARAYLSRDGKLYRLTKDDTWVQKQVEAGLISEKEAAGHELRNVVTQVLGNKLEIEVNQKEHKLQSGDVFLLCSDGLSDALPAVEMQPIIAASAPPEAARLLIEAAIEAQAGDNITAVVVQISSQKPPSPPPPARKIPKWLPVAIVGGLALLIGVIWLAAVMGGRGDAVEATPTGAADELVGGTAVVPSLVPTAVLPSVTPSPVPALTGVPSPTPVNISSPPPANTPSPTPAQTYACTVNQTYVWRTEQLDAGNCNQMVTENEFVLPPNHKTLLFAQRIRTVEGPDAECAENEFVYIQSVVNPDVEGWVLAYTVNPLPTDESCPE